jgi:hypothetical protein
VNTVDRSSPDRQRCPNKLLHSTPPRFALGAREAVFDAVQKARHSAKARVARALRFAASIPLLAVPPSCATPRRPFVPGLEPSLGRRVTGVRRCTDVPPENPNSLKLESGRF